MEFRWNFGGISVESRWNFGGISVVLFCQIFGEILQQVFVNFSQIFGQFQTFSNEILVEF